jgi:hypothetical protein
MESRNGFRNAEAIDRYSKEKQYGQWYVFGIQKERLLH